MKVQFKNPSTFLSKAENNLSKHLKNHQLNLIRTNKKLKFYSIFKNETNHSEFINHIRNPEHRRVTSGVQKTQTQKRQTTDLRPRKPRPRKHRPRKHRPRKPRPRKHRPRKDRPRNLKRVLKTQIFDENSLRMALI